MTTRIQWLRNLLFSSKAACRVLDRTETDEALKDALNNEQRIFWALFKGARLKDTEIDRMLDQAPIKAGWVGANINDVDTVRMVARY